MVKNVPERSSQWRPKNGSDDFLPRELVLLEGFSFCFVVVVVIVVVVVQKAISQSKN
jgi:hypothetical protein